MKFELGELDVIISGDIAIVVVEEDLTQRGYDGVIAQPGARHQRFRARRQPMVHGNASWLARPGATRGSEPQLQ